MTRLKDRKLKKKRTPEQHISWKSVLAMGVDDTKENKKRWANGEALDLTFEAIEKEEALKIKHDPVTNKINVDFLEEQEQSEQESLEQFNKDKDQE